KEAPKEEVERMIIESGGVKSLIGCLHGITEIHKAKKQSENDENVSEEAANNSMEKVTADGGKRRECPVPDGLPKSREEMEEEENGKMPDSPFTRLLRAKGKFPAWYSPAPDHETD
ncbi:CCG-binding protein 1, partial [Tanacetum coccineum]